MRKLNSFIQVSLDGMYADAKSDMSWAHKPPTDTEWNEFVSGNASGGGALLFGRVTYDMMASFWPTPMAAKTMPVVAERMNAMPKFVVSRTRDSVSWQNTTVLKGDLATSIRTLKASPGDDLVILGSGSVVSQLARERLIDEFQVIVNPLVLGKGKALFDGVTERLDLKLVTTRAFKNGSVLLSYAPVR